MLIACICVFFLSLQPHLLVSKKARVLPDKAEIKQDTNLESAAVARFLASRRCFLRSEGSVMAERSTSRLRRLREGPSPETPADGVEPEGAREYERCMKPCASPLPESVGGPVEEPRDAPRSIAAAASSSGRPSTGLHCIRGRAQPLKAGRPGLLAAAASVQACPCRDCAPM